MTDLITVAILAKDKAHCLPLFLQCLEAQTWPKSKTIIYIRSNNNNDKTTDVLKAWIEKAKTLGYKHIQSDFTDVPEKVQDYKPHEWNALRFKVLGKIRQTSVEYAKEVKSHYMVIDCDNFITPDVLETMYQSNLPVVAPMLIEPGKFYSNYHSSIDDSGYFLDDSIYRPIHSRQVKGLIELPVVHCTYFIRHEVLDKVSYLDDTERHEYVIFSHSLRKQGISQYLDNRKHYGYITMVDTAEDLKKQEIDFTGSSTVGNVWQKIYDNNTWDGGSGPGSKPENTVEYRELLQRFMDEREIKSVIDIGCGDWQFSKLIDWKDVNYTGIDCVKSVVEKNQKDYTKPNVKFLQLDILKDKLELKADMIILKDVLQHWPNADISRTLGTLIHHAKYILITNSVDKSTDGTTPDIALGGFRPLSRTKRPLSILSPERVLSYRDKEVILIRGNPK